MSHAEVKNRNAQHKATAEFVFCKTVTSSHNELRGVYISESEADTANYRLSSFIAYLWCMTVLRLTMDPYSIHSFPRLQILTSISANLHFYIYMCLPRATGLVTEELGFDSRQGK